jgi:hypothetical protein
VAEPVVLWADLLILLGSHAPTSHNGLSHRAPIPATDEVRLTAYPVSTNRRLGYATASRPRPRAATTPAHAATADRTFNLPDALRGDYWKLLQG